MGGLEFSSTKKRRKRGADKESRPADLSAEQLAKEQELEDQILASMTGNEEETPNIETQEDPLKLCSKGAKEGIEYVTRTIRIPIELNEILDNYIQEEARRFESKNHCMIEGIKLYLRKYKR